MVVQKDSLLEVTPESRIAIRKKYNLDNDRMEQSVDILEQWIKKQNHFVNKSFTRSYLETSIIVCKGSVEKAKLQIDKLCTFKTLLPRYFISGGVKEILTRVDDKTFFIPLPKTTKEYERIFLLQISNKEFTSSEVFDFFRKILVIADYIKHHDYIDGIVIIDDLRFVNLTDLMTKINVTELQELVKILIDGFGARLKGIHVISESKFIGWFVNTIKTVISEKLQKRIQVHPALDDLYRVFDKELLPVELGGRQKPLIELQDAWREVLSSPDYEEHLAAMKASKTDESLREKNIFNEQCMGLPGSFRSLTVD